MVKGLSDLQVGCMKYQSHPAPLVVPLFHHGRVGRGLGTCSLLLPPLQLQGFSSPFLASGKVWET